MSAQIEARRLSGVDIGKEVNLDGTVGALQHVRHTHGFTYLAIENEPGEWFFAHADLVTISGRTTTPTPKETP